MPEENTDRERILALEVELRSLQTLLAAQREADTKASDAAQRQLLAQLTALATRADSFAEVGAVQKNTTRLEAVEQTITRFRAELVPRSELQARLETVVSAQSQMQQLIVKLDAALQRLSDEWTDEANDRRVEEADAYRRRNFIIGSIAAVAAVAAVLVSVIFNLGGHTTVYQPTPTTVSVPAGTTGR